MRPYAISSIPDSTTLPLFPASGTRETSPHNLSRQALDALNVAAVQSLPMSTPSLLDRFLATSRQYLDESEPEHIRQATELLRAEFFEAIDKGPKAMLSSPQTMREERLPLHRVVQLVLEDKGVAQGLIHELAMRDGSVLMFLADAYANWVVASYVRVGAFHD
jgi:hypothetical protein